MCAAAGRRGPTGPACWAGAPVAAAATRPVPHSASAAYRRPTRAPFTVTRLANAGPGLAAGRDHTGQPQPAGPPGADQVRGARHDHPVQPAARGVQGHDHQRDHGPRLRPRRRAGGGDRLQRAARAGVRTGLVGLAGCWAWRWTTPAGTASRWRPAISPSTVNYIGLNLSGAAFGNHGDGVFVAASSWGNTIGENLASKSGAVSNVISGNAGNGITLSGSSVNTVAANRIGTNAGRARRPSPTATTAWPSSAARTRTRSAAPRSWTPPPARRTTPPAARAP